jgi:hypothetical protein
MSDLPAWRHTPRRLEAEYLNVPLQPSALGRSVALVLAVYLALLAGSALAESKPKIKPYSVIIGTVFDQKGRTVPGVKVKIQRQGDKHPKWELVSDSNGEFAQRFPAGKADYVIWAELKGKKGHVSETKVHIDNDERQDIGLHLPE